MEYRAIDVSNYDFKPEDKLLLDTNIWLFVYGPPQSDHKKVRIYSQALKDILTAQSYIYIDVLIISEFINRYARMKRKILALGDSRFKDFRKSLGFKQVAQAIAADLKCMLKLCVHIDSGPDASMIDQLIDEYAVGGSDFNDQILVALCRDKGLKLVTDDSDFNEQGICVVTANRQLLD